MLCFPYFFKRVPPTSCALLYCFQVQFLIELCLRALKPRAFQTPLLDLSVEEKLEGRFKDEPPLPPPASISPGSPFSSRKGAI
jgi:hypothetical protein